MRIQPNTILISASSLHLAVAAARFELGVFGLPAIPSGAKPPAAGESQSFPSWLRITHYINSLFLTLLIGEGEGGCNQDREYFDELANSGEF